MSKDEFFQSLNNEQIEYCRFLMDMAFANGYDKGVIENMHNYE